MGSTIKKRMGKVYAEAPVVTQPLSDLNLVIFSDHHKGDRDGADDFVPCEAAYEAALNYYFEHAANYRLLLLGDVEELWESTPKSVLSHYDPMFQLEARFHAQNRYWRFVGNHDDSWYSQSEIDKYLSPLFPGLKTFDSLRLVVTHEGQQLGEFFFVHGHQGTLFSEYFAGFSRWFVRVFWRPFQRLFKTSATTPSKDWELRSRHDREMYNWAVEKSQVVMIAGHTHRTVFTATPASAYIETEIQQVQALSGEHAIREELEDVKAFMVEADQPCYFNTGCCSYPDGTITGLEISAGEIRLVRWSAEAGDVRREVLATALLRDIFLKVSKPGAMMAPPPQS